MKLLVTGASGFVGSAVCRAIMSSNHECVASARNIQASVVRADQVVATGDMTATTQWQEALSDVDVVIHCAARVHVMHDRSGDPLAEFRAVNVDGTLNLARQAAAAGVKRLIYISSIKVNGEFTQTGNPFQADDAPAPSDAYGISKMEAEQGLKRIAQEAGLEMVIIRPPLVYGRGVKGNFASMMTLVDRSLPLPLGAIHNKRTLIGVDNLVDLIMTCLDHPNAANQVFLAGDDEDISTTQLLKRLAAAMGRPSRLIPVPATLLKLCATLLGKADMAQRLLGSLQLDTRKTRELLGWSPPISLDEGLRRCVDGIWGAGAT